jgi:cyanophycin synthetase
LKTYQKNKAQKQLAKLTYPIIIKDAKGSRSRGLFAFIKTECEALAVLARELPRYGSMIAQEMVFGREYRVLVLGERVIAVLEMIPPYVIGDGTRNVKELIEKKQKNKQQTVLNRKLEEILADQKVTLKTVLKKGQKIFFKKNSSLDEGGETLDVTDLLHKKIVPICAAASRVVGRNLVGIDIICDNIATDPDKQDFNILEINSKPDLYIHYYPTRGNKQDVVKKIINFMLKINSRVNK